MSAREKQNRQILPNTFSLQQSTSFRSLYCEQENEQYRRKKMYDKANVLLCGVHTLYKSLHSSQ
jgi:hypothetical protein